MTYFFDAAIRDDKETILFLTAFIGMKVIEIQVYGLLILFAYSIINLAMGHVLKLMYSMKFDDAYVESAEKYYMECNPNIKEEVEEEDRILAKAKEIREKRVKESDRLYALYKVKPNPIIQKIKLGIRVLLVLATIGTIIWFVNTDMFKNAVSEMETNIQQIEIPVEVTE